MTERDWKRDLKLGVPEIDAEHGLQIGLVDALEDAVAQGRERELADGILEKLLDFTNVHFLAEELMMRLHEYPQYEAHIAEHDRLVRELEDLRRSYRAGDRGVTLEVIHQLRSWLRGHIETKDLAFARFLTGRGESAGLPS
jgi:hemerythrin